MLFLCLSTHIILPRVFKMSAFVRYSCFKWCTPLVHGYIDCRFYRATLCVSVVFAVARCPSVLLSVTFVHSIQTSEDIVKLLCRPGSLVTRFLTPSAGTQFEEQPLQRGAKYKGVGKSCDFQLKSPYISETVRDRPMVAMKC